MLGGFSRATIRVTAMYRDVCMESSIAQMTLRMPSTHVQIAVKQWLQLTQIDICSNEHFSSQAYFFFQGEGKYPLQGTQNGKWPNNEKKDSQMLKGESAVTQIDVYRSLLRQDFLSLVQ